MASEVAVRGRISRVSQPTVISPLCKAGDFPRPGRYGQLGAEKADRPRISRCWASTAVYARAFTHT